LRTGEKLYLSDPREVGELMVRQIRAERREAQAREPETDHWQEKVRDHADAS